MAKTMDKMNKRGIFITFEGMDGSGKSTQINALKGFFEERQEECVVTREPGGTKVGDKLRDIVLDPANTDIDPVTEVLIYAASRAQLVRQVIKPALERGINVICDRYLDSSIAYQAYGRGLGPAVPMINKEATGGLMPDVTFFLDVKPEEGVRRITEVRNKSGGSLDRIELESSDFKSLVYEGFLSIAESDPERFLIIDGNRSAEEITEEIKAVTENLLNKQGE